MIQKPTVQYMYTFLYHNCIKIAVAPGQLFRSVKSKQQAFGSASPKPPFHTKSCNSDIERTVKGRSILLSFYITVSISPSWYYGACVPIEQATGFTCSYHVLGPVIEKAPQDCLMKIPVHKFRRNSSVCEWLLTAQLQVHIQYLFAWFRHTSVSGQH